MDPTARISDHPEHVTCLLMPPTAMVMHGRVRDSIGGRGASGLWSAGGVLVEGTPGHSRALVPIQDHLITDQIRARVAKRFIKSPLNRKERTPNSVSWTRGVAPQCWS